MHLGVVGNAGFRAGKLRGFPTSRFTRQECLGTCRQECRRYAATNNFEMYGALFRASQVVGEMVAAGRMPAGPADAGVRRSLLETLKKGQKISKFIG